MFITLFLTIFSSGILSIRFSPTLIIARLIVGRQTPEYVGARQKRFAWIIGLVLSPPCLFFIVGVNAYSRSPNYLPYLSDLSVL